MHIEFIFFIFLFTIMNIEEAKKQKCACIYKFTFPDGKCYVGKSKDLSKRIGLYERVLIGDGEKKSKVLDAIREFGFSNIEVDILCSPSGLNVKDLDLALSILEISYIRDLKTIYPDGYNVSIGGELLNIPVDLIQTGTIFNGYGTSKPVLVYDLNGELVEEYPSIEKCAYNLGVETKVITNALDRRREPLHGKYMLRTKKYGKAPAQILPYQKEYVEKKVINVVYEDKVIEREKIVCKPSNPILKYNKDGDFCGQYDTMMDAAMSIGSKSAPKGVLFKGYIFLDYDGGEIKQNIGEVRQKSVRLPKYSDALEKIGDEALDISDTKGGWSKLINDFKVAQYTKQGELVNIYDSINDASYETGILYSSIWACVFGRTKSAKGFVWRKFNGDK